MIDLETTRKRLSQKLKWDDIDSKYLEQLIAFARLEDIEGLGLQALPQRPGDLSSAYLSTNHLRNARIVAREDLTLSGIHLIPLILNAYGNGASFEADFKDGDHVPKTGTIGHLSGPIDLILQAERVLLNFLQHLSGIATLTKRYCKALGEAQTRLLDTRKTTPAYRILEKYAVTCGGGWNHRLGLYDRIMLKDNHFAESGLDNLAAWIRDIRDKWPQLPIEIEADHIEQLDPILDAQPDVILLDNFSLDELRIGVQKAQGRCLTESSGNITLERLPQMRDIGLDFISTGAITHQSQWVDIGLDI